MASGPHPTRVNYLTRLRAHRAVDIPSAVVALSFTMAAFASVLVVSTRTFSLDFTAPRVDHSSPHETLVYLERPVIAVRRDEQSIPTRMPHAATERTAAAPVRVRADTASVRTSFPPTSAKSEALAGPAPVFLPRYRTQPRFTPSPFDLPRVRNPFLPQAEWTRAQMDSMLEEMRHAIPILAAARTPTAAERDALIKEQTRERLIPGRAAQMPAAAGMSISLPLFAAGPSAAERRRDSAANAEYVLRLRRLQARASASRELLRVADSMSRVRTP